VIAAYGSFALADELHWSGVIATVTAGLLVGSAPVICVAYIGALSPAVDSPPLNVRAE
jgi:NhaP-type Na+/H+ or K+/H+ antiporter